jgi:hypothetical protein
MNLDRIKPGDTVTVNVRGWAFEAIAVERTDDGRLRIEPPPRCTYYKVTARQVVGHRDNRYNPEHSQVRVSSR